MDKKTAVPMTGDELFKTFFFFVAFIPYICLIYNGINGFFFFSFFTGYDALGFSLLFSPLIIFVPLSVIYQIVYAVKHLGDHPLLRKISLVPVLCIIAGFIAVGPLSGLVTDIRASGDPDRIREYLAGKYGEEFVADIKIDRYMEAKPKHVRQYKVSSDVLPEGDGFTVRNEPNPKDYYFYTDDLLERFADENSPYLNSFSADLKKEFDIPANMKIVPDIRSIEFGDYRYGDQYSGLFDRTDYGIDWIDVYVDEYTEDNVLGSIDKFWKDIYPAISGRVDGFLTLYIRDRHYHGLPVSVSIRDNGEAFAKFSDESGAVFGRSVEDHMIYLKP